MQYLEPLLTQEISHSGKTILIEAWGKDSSLDDDLGLSMREFKKDGKWFGSKPRDHLVAYAMKKHISVYLSPSPVEMNGKMCHDFDLGHLRFPISTNLEVLRGVNADACKFKHRKGVAWVMSPADCLTLVGIDGENVICGHGARKSLLSDTIAIDSNDHEIINTSVTRHFIEMGAKAKVWLGLCQEELRFSLTNPQHATKNKMLLRAIRQFAAIEESDDSFPVDLLQIASSQILCGSPHDNRPVVTINDKRTDDKWYSHGRGDKARNLVIVTCV